MSQGGSRHGAGRPRQHQHTHTMRTIDVRRLARESLLYDGASFTWVWQDDDGHVTASIWLWVESGAVRFTYRTNGEHDVDDRARLMSTSCNYGGTRPWFACPCCRRRCAVLYLGKRVACRHCYQLRYPSQSEDVIARTWRAQRALEDRLGGSDYWRKPKGMHQTTFDRIRERIADQEAIRSAAFVAQGQRRFPWLSGSSEG